jgi:hypothetical protein
MDNTDIVAAIALTVALVALIVAVVAHIDADASVNSESIERMTREQLRKSLNAIRVECEVEQIRRHCRRCRKWSRG